MKHIETILIKHQINYIEQSMVRQGKYISFHLIANIFHITSLYSIINKTI